MKPGDPLDEHVLYDLQHFDHTRRAVSFREFRRKWGDGGGRREHAIHIGDTVPLGSFAVLFQVSFLWISLIKQNALQSVSFSLFGITGPFIVMIYKIIAEVMLTWFSIYSSMLIGFSLGMACFVTSFAFSSGLVSNWHVLQIKRSTTCSRTFTKRSPLWTILSNASYCSTWPRLASSKWAPTCFNLRDDLSFEYLLIFPFRLLVDSDCNHVATGKLHVKHFGL